MYSVHCTVQPIVSVRLFFLNQRTYRRTNGVYTSTLLHVSYPILSVQYILSDATQMFRGFDQDIMDTLYFLTFKHLCVEGNNKREINIYSLFLCDRSGDRSDGLYHSKPFQ